ncbi:translation initiation factor IF-2 N-terminal domain-containing protein, partial [Streptomyces hygroscopicus]|uniref:translation initiation factor IF-2 N-terminal domain-containing protein n=1 Tax=Streptomyces hygroscopicus TaxID=1912 RepID=UPI00340D58BD
MAKVRVYELAKEFGVESKVVMAKLQELGEFVRSASSTIEAPVVRKLTDAFQGGNGSGRAAGKPSAPRKATPKPPTPGPAAAARPAAPKPPTPGPHARKTCGTKHPQKETPATQKTDFPDWPAG